MNDIDEFFAVALALFLAIAGLLFLLTYLEQTISEPVKGSFRQKIGRPQASTAAGRGLLRWRKNPK